MTKTDKECRMQTSKFNVKKYLEKIDKVRQQWRTDMSEDNKEQNQSQPKRIATGKELVKRAENAIKQQREKEFADRIKCQAALVTRAEDLLKAERLKMEAIIEEYDAGL